MKLRLIDDWKWSYKFGSVQLAAVIAILSGIMAANPGLLLGLIGFLPAGPLRYVAAALVTLVVFIIPTLSRVVQKAPKP